MRIENDIDEDYFADVGFMFESQQPVRMERFQWDIPNKIQSVTTSKSLNEVVTEVAEIESITENNVNKISVAIHVADDNPGAIQSGHYLWPAAIMLSEYLIHNYCSSLILNNHTAPTAIRTVIELGAGCGLSSLTVLQLWKDSLQCICVTDHDPGTLVRAQDNYEITIQGLIENTNCKDVKNQDVQLNDKDCDDLYDEQLNGTINSIASIPILFEFLEWGNDKAIYHILNNLLPDHTSTQILSPKLPSSPSSTPINPEQEFTVKNYSNKFDIVLGSDLIYCKEVVRPLFKTVVQLMVPLASRFILAQSFVYDDETENDIEGICSEFYLQRTIVVDTFLKTGKGSRTTETNNATTSTGSSTQANVGRIQEFVLLQ